MVTIVFFLSQFWCRTRGWDGARPCCAAGRAPRAMPHQGAAALRPAASGLRGAESLATLIKTPFSVLLGKVQRNPLFILND